MEDLAARSARRKPLARRIHDLLVAEGFRPRLIRQAPPFEMFTFDHEGDRFFVQLVADDEDFLQLNLAYRLPEPRPTELTALRAAHDLQGSSKLIKIFIGRNREFVEFQAPLLLGGHPLRRELLRRCMSMLRAVAGQFTASLLAQMAPVAHA
jgi:hypothetical protein